MPCSRLRVVSGVTPGVHDMSASAGQRGLSLRILNGPLLLNDIIYLDSARLQL